jgi:hypothetical protein
MVISHKYKFIFIHLGKTGGDSVTQALADFCDPSRRDVVKENQTLHKNFHKHAKAWEIQKGFEELRWNYQRYFKFFVIRNPYEILHSDYYFHKYAGEKYYPESPPEPGIKDYDWFFKCHKTKDMTFSDYVKNVYGHWDKGFIANWGMDFNKKLIVDYICRNENLDQDFSYVCGKVGLPNIQLPKANTTQELLSKKRPSPKEDFTPELIEFVEKTFSEEIKRYGYSL